MRKINDCKPLAIITWLKQNKNKTKKKDLMPIELANLGNYFL